MSSATLTETDESVSVENSGVPSGRLPKELFGVTLIFEEETYPNWPTPRPKRRRKRQHWLFTKKSSQTSLVERLLKLDMLDKAEVLVLHGSIEWTEVEKLEVVDE